ncbi:MAG: hypothetical protein NVSMB57_15780 [Actinomycetota bacterium]
MREIIASFLRERDISFAADGEAFSFVVPGDTKHSIGVGFAMSDAGLRVESFFMRAPQENAREVYQMLLARNARGRLAWFAIDAHGDAYLLGFLPRNAVDERSLDELLGEVVSTCDEMFSGIVARGFESYLARDLAWRSKQSPEKPATG